MNIFVQQSYKAKKRKQNNKWLLVFYGVILIGILCTVAFLWGPANNKPANNILNGMPSGFKTLATDYLGVMKNLNSSQTKTKMAAMLNPNYNQTDLFAWEGSKLTFANDPNGLV